MEYFGLWNPEVLYVRGEQINVPVLLSCLLGSQKKSDAYIDCFIKRVCPRLVITFIDNGLSFYKISQRNSEVKTLFIQNGWRTYYADIFEMLDKWESQLNSSLTVDYMAVFGNCVGDEYRSYIQGETVLIGSIKNNFVPKKKLPQRGVLTFISQWQPDGLFLRDAFYSQEDYFGQADRLIINCLVNYAEKTNKRFMIIPRHDKNSDLRAMEEVYFRSLVGGDLEYIDMNGLYPSYQAADASEVVVGVDTTLVYESIARGNKTAVFSIRTALLGDPLTSMIYGWPGDFANEGPFWTKNPDPDSFTRILDYLFEVDDVQWQKDVEATNFSSLMVYDPGNSMLKATFEEELGPPPTSEH
jgi:surface carbohydrate biosynthesis protein